MRRVSPEGGSRRQGGTMSYWWLEFSRGLVGSLIAGCLALFVGLVIAAMVFMVMFLAVALFG